MTAKRKRGTKRSKAQLAAVPELVPTDEVEKLPKLSKLHMLFCTHYAMSFNGTKSVIDAGIPSVRPNEMARFLLSKPDIQKAIRVIRKDFGELHFDLRNQLLEQYNAMRMADPTKMLDENGNLKPPNEWPEDCKLLLNGLEVEEMTIGDGAGMQRIKKVKLESRRGVMDSMNRVIGGFNDKVDHTSGGKPLAAGSTVVYNVTVGGKPA